MNKKLRVFRSEKNRLIKSATVTASNIPQGWRMTTFKGQKTRILVLSHYLPKRFKASLAAAKSCPAALPYHASACA